MNTTLHTFAILCVLGAVCAFPQDDLGYNLQKYVEFDESTGSFSYACPESLQPSLGNFYIVWGFGDDQGQNGWQQGVVTPVLSNGCYRANLEIPEFKITPGIYGCKLVNGEFVKIEHLLRSAPWDDDESKSIRIRQDENYIASLAGPYADKPNSAQYLYARSRTDWPGYFDRKGSLVNSYNSWTSAYKVVFLSQGCIFSLNDDINVDDHSLVGVVKQYLISMAQTNAAVFQSVISEADLSDHFTSSGSIRNALVRDVSHAKILCYARLESEYAVFYSVYFRLSNGSTIDDGDVRYARLSCFKVDNTIKICGDFGIDSKIHRMWEICGVDLFDANGIRLLRGAKTDVVPRLKASCLPSFFTEWP